METRSRGMYDVLSIRKVDKQCVNMFYIIFLSNYNFSISGHGYMVPYKGINGFKIRYTWGKSSFRVPNQSKDHGFRIPYIIYDVFTSLRTILVIYSMIFIIYMIYI